MQKPKLIHFVGIKGVGVAPLALIAKEAGIAVTGSDIADGFITDSILQRHGIIPFIDFNVSHITGSDLVITTGAHGGYDNIEVAAAKKQNIPIFTQGQAVGEFMKGDILGVSRFKNISVGGTHGKTTTTAMIAAVLQSAGGDPSWIVGTSEITNFGDGGHFGKGKYFVAEADEYANEPTYDKTPKMLLQYPDIAVITNVEHDHPDVYPTLKSAYNAFLQFVSLVPSDGIVVACGDDKGVQEVLKNYSQEVLTYGFGENSTYKIENVSTAFGGTAWQMVSSKNHVTLSLRLQLPGKHNILNASAAAIVCLQCGLTQEQISSALFSFRGTKRRMEYVGQILSGALLYDDYAHHPTEIEKTLLALKEKYPNSHIVCIFQPHTYSRTKLLFDQFVYSLSLADEIVLSDIYSSKREAYDPTVSSAMLVEKLLKKKPAVLAKTLADVIKYIRSKSYGENTIVLTMGAGDIYQIANELLEH